MECRLLWWLLPKHTYFGEKPWGEEQWADLGLPKLRDEALEWSADDRAPIFSIVDAHCEGGWNVGWDLYFISSDGTLVGFLDHHNVLSVRARRRGDAEVLSRRLAVLGVDSEVYPETSDG